MRFPALFVVVLFAPVAVAQDHDFRGYWRDTNPPGAYCAPVVVGDGNVSPEVDVCRGTFAWSLESISLSAWTIELGLNLYVSSAEEECFVLYDVDEGDPDYLDGGPSMAVWDDLGSGVGFSAETCVGSEDVGSVVFVSLLEPAWEEIAVGGWFGIGIEMTTLDGTRAPAPNGEQAELVRFGFARLRNEMLVFADGFETGDALNWSERQD